MKVVRIIKTILITQTNELIDTTPKERIMQKSKLVDELHFIVDTLYKGTDMSTFTMVMEYKLPISNEYKTQILEQAPELYEGMLEYKIPIDTDITKYPGNVEIQITMSKLESDDRGKVLQRVRKVQPTVLKIYPIAAWSDMIPDADLTALDQRILKQDAQIKELNELADKLNMTKADNLSYSKNILQLTSNGEKIGDAVSITSGGSSTGDFEIVEF